MVNTPEKSCVAPMSRPSENVSTSAMTRLTRSPDAWESKYDRGSAWIFLIAAFRKSRDTQYAIW